MQPKIVISDPPLQPAQHPRAAISSSLRALAAVASRLGLSVSGDELQRRFALEPGEPDTRTLIALAQELGLDAKSLSMSFQELPRLGRAFPAILRAKDGGALILEDARSDPGTGTVAVIRDPCETADVVVTVDELHLADVWKGEAILIKRDFSAADEERPFSTAWFVGQLLRERTLFKQIALSAFVSTVFAIAPPLLVMVTIDRVMVYQSWSTLNVLAFGILVMLIFEMVLSYFRRILTTVVMSRIDGRLNLYIVEKLLKLPMDFFEHNPTGRILSKIGSINIIRVFFSQQLFGAFLDVVPLVGLIPVMVILVWQLALIAFVLAGIMFIIIMIFMKPLARLHKEVVRAEHSKWSHLTETIYGIRTVKSLVLEAQRRREWDRRVANVTTARHAFGLMANYPVTLTLAPERLIYSGSLIIGCYFVLSSMGPNGLPIPGSAGSSITAGTLVGFALLAIRVAQPLVKLANLQMDIAEVRSAIGQVGEIINVAPEATRVNGMRLPIKGEVSFKDVRFRYTTTAPCALDGVSFTVPAGTTLGIMGRSGSGKTTVTRLLQRLNTSYEGMIKIDGMDLRDVDLTHLRMNIGVVPQENFLFSGTIRENIAMAKPEASFADVVRAAQLSGAEEFIEHLPRGYDTVLEEGATNLSGGQRQRLALARALIIDPPVLILDEATSALDAESEAIVNANLARMAKGRTVLSISHRLSMLVDCDAILVLERGKVYDIGRHEELLQRCDVYKHMWYQQNRHLDPRAAEKAMIVRGVVR